MNRSRLILLLLAFTLVSSAIAQQPFRLVFSNTSLSSVLRAIGLRSGANIVYVGKEDPSVTLNVTAGNTEEALRFATTAAGVIFRRAGTTYVVAAPGDMRRAIEPFGLRYRIPLEGLSPAEATAILTRALPYLTIQPAGSQIMVTGTRDDIDQAREIIREQEALAAGGTRESMAREVLQVKRLDLDGAQGLVRQLFPELSITSVKKGEGGMLVVSGPADRVKEASQTLVDLDSDVPSGAGAEIYHAYLLRYSSAPVVIKFMQEAVPDVRVISGPSAYAPAAPEFNPLSGATLQAQVQGQSISGAGGTNEAQRNEQLDPRRATTTATQLQEVEDRATHVIIRGRPDRVAVALNLLKELDIKPKQVVIEVKVVDYSPTSDSQVGLNWNWSSLNSYELPPGTPITVQGDDPIAPFTNFNTRPGGFGVFSRMPWAFQAILDAAITRREARLLATPSVQVVDGKDANIFIGDTIRARVAQTGALGGQTVQIVEFPIGIVLLIRPRVNADGDITMRVHPVVSTITGLDDENIPQTSTREAETTIVVGDGETMVLGGLIRDEMSKTVREIPLLSKLPLIGELFRSTTVNGRKSEILIFITPRIVDDAERTAVPVPASGEKAADKGTTK